MVIRLRLHGDHSKGNTPKYRLCRTPEETTPKSRLPRRIQKHMQDSSGALTWNS